MVTAPTAEAEFNRQQGKYIERFFARGNAASKSETVHVIIFNVCFYFFVVNTEILSHCIVSVTCALCDQWCVRQILFVKWISNGYLY